MVGILKTNKTLKNLDLQNNEITSKLYNTLVAIQKGDMSALDDWIYII